MSIKARINKILSMNVEPMALQRSYQEKLLNKFAEPRNLYERSYFQYKIQAQLFPFYKKLLNNLVGFLTIPFLLALASLKNKDTRLKPTSNKRVAVFPYKNLNYQDIIPFELKDEFEIVSIDFGIGLNVKWEDLLFVFNTFKKYPFSPYFVSKILYKILFYRYILNNYAPSAIVSSAEYSFTSSVTTLFCRQNMVEHINVMHGEKLFYIRDSFFEFDRFYVWDDFYRRLFIKLKASARQFVIGTFPSLTLNIDLKAMPIYKYTYYLAAEDENTLTRISSALAMLARPDKISVRFHPRYSDSNQINRIFGQFCIQNSREITLEQSFADTEYVISLYSSVLLQASVNNKKVVIDDYCHSSEKIRRLKDAEYIIFVKEHNLLSNLISS